MKTTLLSLAVAAALSIASIASAAPASAAQEAASESVKISAPRYHIEPSEFSEYLYAYKLSNGDMLRFSNRVGHYYAQVKGQPKVEIFATGPAEFVTDTGTRMKFTEDGDTLTINNYERLPMAAHLPANTMVMAKR
jgi:hypothetical protein